MKPYQCILFTALITALGLASAVPAQAATFTVDREDDVNPPATACDDAVPDDCSLRGAIIKANASPEADAVLS